MKSIRNAALLVTLFVFSLGLHASAQTVRDFTGGGFDYGFEDWKDLGSVQSKTATGGELKGTAKGGAGVFFADTPVDISGCAQLEVKVRQGSTNTQEKLLVRLQSADGKSTMLTVSLKDAKKDALDSVLIDLAPLKQATDGVNWKAVTGLQVQGDFTPGTVMDFELGSISGKSVPAAAPAPAAAK